MARGQAQAADQQRNLSNTQAGTQFGNAQQLYGTLAPAATDQLKNPGYTPADKTNITNSTLGAIQSNFGGAEQQNADRVARTRNSAGSSELADELARNRGQAAAGATASLGTKFADTALSEKDKAMQTLGQLYGVNTGTGTSLYGQGAGDLQARAAGGPGIMSSLIGAGGAALGGYLGRRS